LTLPLVYRAVKVAYATSYSVVCHI
jgi:hypothetical protein